MNYDRFLTRVYDKQEKKMIYNGDIFYTDAGDECFFVAINPCDKSMHAYDDEGNGIVLFLEDRFIPMQCWGLSDKNKKLIYESDIVKIIETGEIAIIECLRKTDKPIVLNLCPVIQYPQTGRGFHFGTDPDNLEIIGNKWENEKLLEEKQ